MQVEEALDKVRKICMNLPEATEKLSHGSVCWFVQGKRQFAAFLDNHHNDGRLAIWIAAPLGVQEDLAEQGPEWYFRPPYVAHRGWIGVRLDRDLQDNELTDLQVDAYRTIAPAKLSALLDAPVAPTTE